MKIRALVLGCGTSSGVPMIGCDCAVCRSGDPRNQRSRPGLRLEVGERVVLIDTPTDLRQQALSFDTRRVDAVLYTHAHADHVLGLDDLRAFNFRQAGAIPCYGSAETLNEIRRRFRYVFEVGEKGGGKPRIDLKEISGPFELFGLRVTPVPVLHGRSEVLGYRFDRFAYVTDCSEIPEASVELLEGLDILILDALRYDPHPTHFSIAEAIEMAVRLAPRKTFLTHLNHDVDYGEATAALPAGVELAYDGLRFELG